MTTDELIDPEIETVDTEQTIDEILAIMQDGGFQLLPVVEESKFLGFVKEDQLLNIPDSSKSLKSSPIEFSDNYIKNTEHVYSLIYNYLKFNTTMLAVLSENGAYLGSVSQGNLRLLFKDWLCFNSVGGVLILEINLMTYSLSEVCRIVESNGAKVFSAEIIEDQQMKGMNYLTLKFNTDELSRIIAAFERYNYKVTAYYHNSQFENVDQNRLGNLFKFINL